MMLGVGGKKWRGQCGSRKECFTGLILLPVVIFSLNAIYFLCTLTALKSTVNHFSLLTLI